MAEVLRDEDGDQRGELVREIDGGALVASQVRGEIDAQVRTAKAYPRSIKRFIDEALSMATLTEDVAASCIYALPRGGKPIEGPSARLAEIVASAWGNCRVGARTVAEDDAFVTAQGVFQDVERNVHVTFEVRRRITDKNGRRYNDDMIGVTANAACSIALRNAVFKGIPKAFWSSIYDAARKCAVGDIKTIESKRADMLAYFGKMGVTPDRVLAAIGVGAVEDIGAEELATLKGVAAALKDGETTPEQAFPAAQKAETKAKGAAAVMEKLGERRTEQPKGTAEEKPAKKPAADPAPATDDDGSLL